jgi:hypothetical protein
MSFRGPLKFLLSVFYNFKCKNVFKNHWLNLFLLFVVIVTITAFLIYQTIC